MVQQGADDDVQDDFSSLRLNPNANLTDQFTTDDHQSSSSSQSLFPDLETTAAAAAPGVAAAAPTIGASDLSPTEHFIARIEHLNDGIVASNSRTLVDGTTAITLSTKSGSNEGSISNKSYFRLAAPSKDSLHLNHDNNTKQGGITSVITSTLHTGTSRNLIDSNSSNGTFAVDLASSLSPPDNLYDDHHDLGASGNAPPTILSSCTSMVRSLLHPPQSKWSLSTWSQHQYNNNSNNHGFFLFSTSNNNNRNQPDNHNPTITSTMDNSLMEDDLTSSLLPPSTSTLNDGIRTSRIPIWHRSWKHICSLSTLVEILRTLQRSIRGMGDYLAYMTLIMMLIGVPLALYRTLRDRKLDMAAFDSAWVMVCGTIVLSSRLVYLHLTHWYMPDVQKYVVRILWMVPLYAIQSYWSLRYHEARIYIDTIRDLYEAYVIASFVYYLIALLGGQDALVQILLRKSQYPNQLGYHPFPLSYLMQPWELGNEFMLQCKHGVLQYVVLKIFSTLLTFVCESLGIYGEGKFDWKVAYPYLCFVQNISVMYALYCLVMLYSAVYEELRTPIDWKPLGKFLCVKGVIFFTWWQGVIIFYLRAHNVIEHIGSWSSEEVANGLIDYCIVIEMIGFAIAHSYTFPYQEYLPSNLPTTSSSSTTTTTTTRAEHGHVRTRSSRDNNNIDRDEITLAGHNMAEEARGLVGMPNVYNDEEALNGNQHSTEQEEVRATYRPPTTLQRPMGFRDALWSSTVPNETIQDIQRLRNGGVLGGTNNNRNDNNSSPQQNFISMQRLK